MNQQITVIII